MKRTLVKVPRSGRWLTPTRQVTLPRCCHWSLPGRTLSRRRDTGVCGDLCERHAQLDIGTRFFLSDSSSQQRFVASQRGAY